MACPIRVLFGAIGSGFYTGWPDDSFFRVLPAHRRHKRIFSITDQVVPTAKPERFADEREVFGILPLEQGALHSFFMSGSGNINGPHDARIKTCVVHAGAERTWGGIKILHLFRLVAALPKVFR